MIYEVTFPGQQVSPECLRVKSHDFLVKNTGNVGWLKLTWWADSFALINELITRRCQLTKPSIFSIVEFRECSRREGHPCWTCLRIATGSWPAKQFCLTLRAWRSGDIPCYRCMSNIQKLNRITIDQQIFWSRHWAKPLLHAVVLFILTSFMRAWKHVRPILLCYNPYIMASRNDEMDKQPK